MLSKRDRLPVQEIVARRAARAVSSPFLTVKQFPPPADGRRARLGVVVGKTAVRKAVARNRLRRIAFDAGRSRLLHLPPGDYLVILRKGAADLARRDLEHEVRKALQRFVS